MGWTVAVVVALLVIVSLIDLWIQERDYRKFVKELEEYKDE